MEYLLDTQLIEADLILLNKCDLLSREQAEADKAWLETALSPCPGSPYQRPEGRGA